MPSPSHVDSSECQTCKYQVGCLFSCLVTSLDKNPQWTLCWHSDRLVSSMLANNLYLKAVQPLKVTEVHIHSKFPSRHPFAMLSCSKPWHVKFAFLFNRYGIVVNCSIWHWTNGHISKKPLKGSTHPAVDTCVALSSKSYNILICLMVRWIHNYHFVRNQTITPLFDLHSVQDRGLWFSNTYIGSTIMCHMVLSQKIMKGDTII